MPSIAAQPLALTVAAPVTQSPERAAALEWLESDGRGDYACGTVAGPNTRREHGLFVAATGGRRMLLLAAMDVTLERDGQRFDLACHQFATARHPEGYRYGAGFRADPMPEWRYEVPGAALTRRVFMPRGRRDVVSAWTLAADASPGAWRLRVRPLFAYRDEGALTAANPDCNMALRPREGGFSLLPYAGCPEVFIHCAAQIRCEPLWYYRFRHAHDVTIGRAGDEDLFTPCEIVYNLSPGASVGFVAGLEPDAADFAALEAQERNRRAALGLPAIQEDPLSGPLARAADRFLIEEPPGAAQLAGAYPAPESELRWTLIALPGALLHTRQLPQAKACLAAALAQLLKPPAGLGDEPLWFIRAAEQYVDHSRDWDFLRATLAPACETLAQRYIESRAEDGYALAADGLLQSTGLAPLTWMNAVADGQPVTPRAGKPVEVNALWHHVLGLLARWAARRDQADRAQRFAALQEHCARSFRLRFWNPTANCLHDLVDPRDGRFDSAIRPNQLWAVALPSDLLDRHQAAGVLSVAENRLLTARGLRTLSLEDRAFRPRAGAGPTERAAALHQGCVHPWLIGAYVDAVFRVYGRTSRGYARAETALAPLLTEHLGEGCLGQVAACFDGASPHAPCSAPAHAAAMAELIRACVAVRGSAW